jgi:hypothetical protein
VFEGLTVDSISSLQDAITIASDTFFIGRPYFNADTGGFAVIRAGDRSVRVRFEEPYATPPVVNASFSFAQNDPQAVLAEQAVFGNNLSVAITERSEQGFIITLNRSTTVDLTLNWIALAISGARTIMSNGEETAAPVILPPPPPSSSGSSGNNNEEEEEELQEEEPVPEEVPEEVPPATEEEPVEEPEAPVEEPTEPPPEEPAEEPVTEEPQAAEVPPAEEPVEEAPPAEEPTPEPPPVPVEEPPAPVPEEEPQAPAPEPPPSEVGSESGGGEESGG